MIKVIGTGVVYRNDKPHLRAIHAWHPSLVRMDDGELVATFDVGQGAESLDYHTVLTRSRDDGQTWAAPLSVFEDPIQPSSHTVRLGRTQDGLLTAMGARWRRNASQELINRANLGFIPTEIILLTSRDCGRSWSGPRVIPLPLQGPAFEVCHSIIELADGRWLWPTATWKGWDGDAPNGMKCIAVVSRDRGLTWPEYLDVTDDYRNGIINWEVSLCPLSAGRLVAVTWLFHEPSGTTRPSCYVISQDGQTFGRPHPTGFRAQTAKLLALDDDRVLCVYRRDDQPGLWANLADLKTPAWHTLAEIPLWQGASSGMSARNNNSDELSGLRFGFPTLARLPNNEALILFWCMEDAIQNIRWIRVKIA